MPRKAITAALKPEHALIAQGRRVIVGIDEAGRGAWAGPVYAGAVILPLDRGDLSEVLAGVRDSKQMTARARSLLIATIKLHALAWGVGAASSAEIDTLGIVAATCLAMRRAFDQVTAHAPLAPDHLLLDSIKCADLDTWGVPYQSMVRGDRLSLSIAAASVLAKVTRDEVMRDMHLLYPQYHFHDHKGYGTAKHRAALQTFGACAIHRMSFAPMRVQA
ncbi:MAG: ribonuclease HII [bacterium]|nr:ribonuclease HII [bacterium]